MLCIECWVSPGTYADRGLPFYRYPAELVAVSTGVFEGQQCLMTPRTRSQWRAMHTTAANDGVGLQIRWAFRSADQQAKLIRDQLAWGGKLDYLLTWIAAPGYSEHHTPGERSILIVFPLQKNLRIPLHLTGSATMHGNLGLNFPTQ